MRFPRRGLLSTIGIDGNLERAIVEDRALLGSNPSAAVVQWHGNAVALITRMAALLCFCCHAIGPKRKTPGVWGQSPQAWDV